MPKLTPMRLLLFVNLVLCPLFSVAQKLQSKHRGVPEDSLLSDFKNFYERPFWEKSAFISIDEFYIEGAPALTLIKSDTLAVSFSTRDRNRYDIYVSKEDFKCLEHIFQYSLSISLINDAVKGFPSFLYCVYVHTLNPNSKYELSENQFRRLFSTLIEETECQQNCLQTETRNNVIRILKQQQQVGRF